MIGFVWLWLKATGLSAVWLLLIAALASAFNRGVVPMLTLVLVGLDAYRWGPTLRAACDRRLVGD